MRTRGALQDQTFDMLTMRRLLGEDKEESVKAILGIITQVLFSQQKRRRDFADDVMERVRDARASQE